MIKPTIGRVVWFHAAEHLPGTQPFAALVCHVHNDTTVNLAVFDENGHAKRATVVPLYQGEGDRPAQGTAYAEWMPYQIGQAAKHAEENRGKDAAAIARADLANGEEAPA